MHKEILVNAEPQEIRVAMLENNILEEFYVERADQKTIVGNIYKAKVSTIVPGIEAAFIDLGLEKNGFLYVADIIGPSPEMQDITEEEEPRPGRNLGQGHNNIQNLLKKNQQIIVQVVKESFGTKGVRLTTNISLPGRYLVLSPTRKQIGISKKIDDPKERDRIRSIIKEIKMPPDMGLIVRTAGMGKTKKDFIRDFKYLYGLWRKIKATAARKNPPAVVHEEQDLILRVVRDFVTEDISRIVVDSKLEYKRISKFLKILVPQMRNRLLMHAQDEPLFVKKGIDKEIEKIYQRRVDLKSGAYIVIEPTESLVTIDVNTGRYTGKKRLEDTVFEVNIEAAREIARQIRLRDLGGIIITDFIDMESMGNRRKVMAVLEEETKRDKAKINIFSWSELGLVQMSRQRVRKSVGSLAYRQCPYCQGRGIVKSITTMSITAMRMIKNFLKQSGKREAQVSVHPDLASRLFNEDRVLIENLERMLRAKIVIKPESSLHLEDVRIE